MLWITKTPLIQYSGANQNTDHLSTGNVWIPKFLKFRFQIVWYSNGWYMGYILCTRPTIQITDQCIRKQDGIHLSGTQTVGLFHIQMTLKNQTIWHPWPEYQISSLFGSPLSNNHPNSRHLNTVVLVSGNQVTSLFEWWTLWSRFQMFLHIQSRFQAMSQNLSHSVHLITGPLTFGQVWTKFSANRGTDSRFVLEANLKSL